MVARARFGLKAGAASTGVATAITPTHLAPAVALLWGRLLLGEAMGPALLFGAAVILIDTTVATGLWHSQKPAGRAR